MAKPRAAATALPKLDRRRLLALCPRRNPSVEWSPQDAAGPVSIQVPMQRKPVPAALRWLAKALVRTPPAAQRRIDLDPVGSFVWRSADGQATVRSITWHLATEFSLNRRDAEVALFEFLGQLSARNLLGFSGPAPAGK